MIVLKYYFDLPFIITLKSPKNLSTNIKFIHLFIHSSTVMALNMQFEFWTPQMILTPKPMQDVPWESVTIICPYKVRSL